MGDQARDRAGERWAVSLRSGTLQGMVALRLLLKSSLANGSPQALTGAAEQAIHQLEHEVAELRGLIAEMLAQAE